MTLSARVVFSAGLVVVLALLAWLIVQPFLTYLLAAVLLAFVLRPLHARASDAVGSHLSAGLLVVGTVLAVLLPVGAFVFVVASDVSTLTEGETAIPALESVERLLRTRLGIDVELGGRFRTLAGQIPDLIAGQAPAIVGSGVHTVLGLLLLLFVEYYLLKDGPSLVQWIRGVAPLPDAVGRELFAAAEEMTWAVLKGHVLVAIAQGLVAGLGLLALGIPNAALWTLAMTFLALVPVIGVAPVIGGAIVYLLAEGRLFAAVGLAVYGLTVVALTDDYLRAFLVERHATSLHPAVILVGVFGAAVAFGPMGLFFGPVVLGLFKSSVDVFSRHYNLA
ncbi:AI-2E family transporter [Halomarina litorea]|uniref:AI-2E family transporter n=1 Tax=Halomarina litorea TaxID=2961595 RepID=UPI0020C5A369|nr:AI-2E family transporter [Halomarina sp. BCD28]